jgi:hypothetical protein
MFKRDRAANADTPALERIHSRERSSV